MTGHADDPLSPRSDGWTGDQAVTLGTRELDVAIDRLDRRGAAAVEVLTARGACLVDEVAGEQVRQRLVAPRDAAGGA